MDDLPPRVRRRSHIHRLRVAPGETVGLVLMAAGLAVSLTLAVEGQGLGYFGVAMVTLGAVTWHWCITRRMIERYGRPAAEAYNDGFDEGYDKGWRDAREREALSLVNMHARRRRTSGET